LAESIELAKVYESIRRREHELIVDMLDVLPKIDQLGDERVGQVRDALFHADHPFLMVLVGPFSSGKSSLINALLGHRNLLAIGPTPTTDRISILRWGEQAQSMNSAGEVDTVFHPSDVLKQVSLVDTPGLESIFQKHEETTRKFLHRSDVVLLVMLATQAMSARNLEYLQMFKQYGKKIVIVVNQVDLISEEEQQTVQDYVLQQSQDRLGFKPEIWMISAKQGMAAYDESGERDPEAWEASGMHHFEEYIERQLGDAERLKQKLQTPLQIVQNVHRDALQAVRKSQATFDQYRGITDNIDGQLAQQKREQNKIVQSARTEIEQKVEESIQYSDAAFRDIFRFSRAFGSFGRGILELVGITRLLQRADTPNYVERALKRFKVFEPLDELPKIADKLGPQLEGQDMQDIDDLVKYGQREIEKLPDEMREKVIGSIQAPLKYDRSRLQNMRADLEAIEEKAKVVETEAMEQIFRNTLIYLAAWQLIVIVLLIALFGLWSGFAAGDTALTPWILLVLILSMGLAGFLFMPVRGRMIHTQYANRLHGLRDEYLSKLNLAAEKQIDYGMQLRRETIAPLTRLIESQAHIQDEQLDRLQTAEQQIVDIEGELNALGKRKILGVAI